MSEPLIITPTGQAIIDEGIARWASSGEQINPLTQLMWENTTLLFETCTKAGFLAELPPKFFVFMWVLAGLIALLALWNIYLVIRNRKIKVVDDDEPPIPPESSE